MEHQNRNYFVVPIILSDLNYFPNQLINSGAIKESFFPFLSGGESPPMHAVAPGRSVPPLFWGRLFYKKVFLLQNKVFSICFLFIWNKKGMLNRP
jgi:hypothetical protein